MLDWLGSIFLGLFMALIVGYFMWAILYPIWYHVNDGNLAAAGITALVIFLMFGFRSVLIALFRVVTRR